MHRKELEVDDQEEPLGEHPLLLIAPQGIGSIFGQIQDGSIQPFNCTARNWKLIIGVRDWKKFEELLIAPQGIGKGVGQRNRRGVWQLLIAPQGIDVKLCKVPRCTQANENVYQKTFEI